MNDEVYAVRAVTYKDQLPSMQHLGNLVRQINEVGIMAYGKPWYDRGVVIHSLGLGLSAMIEPRIDVELFDRTRMFQEVVVGALADLVNSYGVEESVLADRSVGLLDGEC